MTGHVELRPEAMPLCGPADTIELSAPPVGRAAMRTAGNGPTWPSIAATACGPTSTTSSNFPAPSATKSG